MYASAEGSEPTRPSSARPTCPSPQRRPHVNGNYLDGITSKDGTGHRRWRVHRDTVAETACVAGLPGDRGRQPHGHVRGRRLKADNAKTPAGLRGGDGRRTAGERRREAMKPRRRVVRAATQAVSAAAASLGTTRLRPKASGDGQRAHPAGSFEIDSADDAIHSNGSVTSTAGRHPGFGGRWPSCDEASR